MDGITTLVWIDSTGYNYEDYPAFLTWLTTQYKAIYGADVYLGSDSQDGQFLAILAQAFYDTAALGAATYNSFSPATAQGVGLSRNVKISGLERDIPGNSTVQLAIGGTGGTVITKGIAIDTLQQQWELPASVTIPGGGTVSVTATSVTPGAIEALANTITGFFTPTQGWQSVNNAAAATVGNPVEDDADLRNRQTNSTAIGAQTVFEATIGAVGNVVGVTEVQGYENPTGSTDANGLPPHSIAIVVVGGSSTPIAEAIRIEKTPGTQTYATGSGEQNIALTDSRGMPIIINFMYAIQAVIGAQVTVVEGTGWAPSTEALIQAAVAAAINAYPIGTGALGAEGSGILITQLYAAAYLYGTPQAGTFTVSSIEIEKNSGGLGTSNILLNFNEYPVCSPTANAPTGVTIII